MKGIAVEVIRKETVGSIAGNIMKIVATIADRDVALN
jgi:hypothetical protein